MFRYYNSLYAEYAWRVVVKATYGMVAVSWPVYGALLLLLNQIWTRPTFLPSLLLLLPPPASLQNSIYESAGDPGVLFNGCLASGQKLPEREIVHPLTVLVVFFLTSSAAHFNAACGPHQRPGCGQTSRPEQIIPSGWT